MQLYLEGVHIQSTQRANRVIPDLKSYIDGRRDDSGCKPSFDLTEYKLGIDLPDFVIDHPVSPLFCKIRMRSVNRSMSIQVIRRLKQEANDFVSWSNVSQ